MAFTDAEYERIKHSLQNLIGDVHANRNTEDAAGGAKGLFGQIKKFEAELGTTASAQDQERLKHLLRLHGQLEESIHHPRMNVNVEWQQKHGPLEIWAWKAAFDLEYVIEDQQDGRWLVYKKRSGKDSEIVTARSMEEAKSAAVSDFTTVR